MKENFMKWLVMPIFQRIFKNLSYRQISKIEVFKIIRISLFIYVYWPQHQSILTQYRR